MSNSFDYVKKYGNVSFAEKPFCEADNVAMCEMFYMPLNLVVSDSFDDSVTPFRYACDKLFALRDNKHTSVGVVLLKSISELMMLMSEQKRYQEMRMIGYKYVFDLNPDVQFNACTFLLPDGTNLILFMGTDDSLRGWKEDFDILSKESVPSSKLAVEYLEEVASRYEGDIIVCGHSKGGFLAQYAAIYCSKKTRDRIKVLYNNDGPGFKDYSFLQTDAYKELLPRYKHFVPQSSFIGMLLYHDDDYEVIKSNKLLGPLQHDLYSWQIEDDKISRFEGLTSLGKLNDTVMYNLVKDLNENQILMLDDVLSKELNGLDKENLTDIKNDIKGSINSFDNTTKELSKESKKQLKDIASNVVTVIKKSIEIVKNNKFSSVEERANKK